MRLLIGLAALVLAAVLPAQAQERSAPSVPAVEAAQSQPAAVDPVQLAQSDPRYTEPNYGGVRPQFRQPVPEPYYGGRQRYDARPAPPPQRYRRYADEDDDEYYYTPRRRRVADYGSVCVTSRGNCRVPGGGPLNSPCRCDIPGFGLKRGAILR